MINHSLQYAIGAGLKLLGTNSELQNWLQKFSSLRQVFIWPFQKDSNKSCSLCSLLTVNSIVLTIICTARGATTAGKFRGQGLGPNTGALAGCWVREGVAPSRCEGSGVLPPEIYLKTQTLNPAFWWLLRLLLWNFLLFENYCCWSPT